MYVLVWMQYTEIKYKSPKPQPSHICKSFFPFFFCVLFVLSFPLFQQQQQQQKGVGGGGGGGK